MITRDTEDADHSAQESQDRAGSGAERIKSDGRTRTRLHSIDRRARRLSSVSHHDRMAAAQPIATVMATAQPIATVRLALPSLFSPPSCPLPRLREEGRLLATNVVEEAVECLFICRYDRILYLFHG